MRSLLGCLVSVLVMLLIAMIVLPVLAILSAIVIPSLAHTWPHSGLILFPRPPLMIPAPLLVLGAFLLAPALIVAVVVWLVRTISGSAPTRTVSGPAPARRDRPRVFDQALAVHRKLESYDARIERLESRLLAKADARRTRGV